MDTSNNNKIWRQHVVSRVLLTRFRDAEDSKNALVGVYDVKTGATFQRSPKSVGFVRNFVRYRTKETEELWADVEGRLPAAFAALDARTIESSPEEMRTIADLVALHFTRSLESLRIHETTFVETELSVQGDHETLKRLARLKHGLYLDAPSILRDMADELLEDLRQQNDSGVLFQEWIEENFRKTQNYLAASRLTIYYADEQVEFLLGDCPAVGIGPGMHPMQRVPLLDASSILMPLGPRALVMIDQGPSETKSTVPVMKDFAQYFNRSQVAQAHKQVYYRPSSKLASLARDYRPPLHPFSS